MDELLDRETGTDDTTNEPENGDRDGEDSSPSSALPNPSNSRPSATRSRPSRTESRASRWSAAGRAIASTRSRAECQHKDDRIAELERRLTECETRTTETDRAADAALKKADANKDRVRELQSRELEKGAHLRTETVDPHEIRVAGDRLEKLTRDDGRTYYRVPDSSDPLDRTDGVALAHGDLLPIQQLARMDADMRRSTANSLPTRLAAKLWQARERTPRSATTPGRL